MQDDGERWKSLVIAMAAYADGFSAEPVIGKAFKLWETLEATS